jgi:hypothetical protein
MQNQERLVELGHIFRQDMAVAHVEAAARESHQQNVEFFRATPEEVEEWYFARDPTDTTSWLLGETAALQEDSGHQLTELVKTSITDSITVGRGGLAILAHELFPRTTTVEPRDEECQWFKRLNTERYQQAAECGHVPPGEMNAHGLLELCLQAADHPDLAFPANRLKHVYLAAEMLRASTIELVQAKNLGIISFTELEGLEAETWAERTFVGKLDAPHIIMAGISEAAMRDLVRKQNVLSDRLLGIVAAYGIQDWEEKYDAYDADDIKMLGLKALMHYSSSWMSDSWERPDPTRREHAKEAFTNMVRAMQHVFGAIEKPINKRLRSPDVKGSLHEILWFMDAYVMRLTDPEKYGEVRVTPAYSRGDAPRIGYPEQRRGIDMYVMCGGIFDYVQLKSSPNKHNGHKSLTVLADAATPKPTELQEQIWEDNEYHPVILKLHEPNFLETNPKRLIAKLNAYARWAANGFDVDEGKTLHKYVLYTVKEELGAIRRRKYDRTTQLKSAVTHYILEPAIQTIDGKKQGPEQPSVELDGKRKAVRKAAKQARRKQRRR